MLHGNVQLFWDSAFPALSSLRSWPLLRGFGNDVCCDMGSYFLCLGRLSSLRTASSAVVTLQRVEAASGSDAEDLLEHWPFPHNHNVEEAASLVHESLLASGFMVALLGTLSLTCVHSRYRMEL